MAGDDNNGLTLSDRLQLKCSGWGTYWRAPDAHGVILNIEQASELLRDALGVEVEIKSAAPAPAVGADALWALLPNSACYLDPPDGGDVPLIEQLRRMARDAGRYRWLRDCDSDQEDLVMLRLSDYGRDELLYGEELDAAIDAALSAPDTTRRHAEGGGK